jgi:enoyl-CoA hydratase
MLKAMLANGPLALAQCIEMVNRGSDVALEEALALEAKAFGHLASSADMREGTSAFLEKRAPNFKGA